jgi:O-antigen/teichoic acid export membrane protein
MKHSTGVVLARNSLYNIITQVLVSVAAVVSIPAVVHGIGEEQFGLLAMIWLVVGYFSVLDFGVGQASVKFLSEQFARGDRERAASIVWVAAGASALFGVVGSLVLLPLLPFFLEHIIHVPANLLDGARESFTWVTLAIPFVMLQSTFRSVPMAVQRFDLVNLLQGLSGLAQWVGSMILVKLGGTLLEIVWLTVIIRVLGSLLSFVLAHRVFPELVRVRPKDTRRMLSTLLKFGGWLTLSQLVSPVTRYLDRIFIAAYHSIRAVTYYTVPYEALSRFQVFPQSLTTTLFPAFAEKQALHNTTEAVRRLYDRAIEYVLLIMLPIGVTFAVYSREILAVWLGGDFPQESTAVFQLLALSIAVHAVAYIPATALPAIGRPDLVAIVNVAEIPVFAGLCWLLIPSFGITGAAWAWMIRLILLTTALLVLAHRELGSTGGVLGMVRLGKGLLVNGALLLALLIPRSLTSSIAVLGTTVLCLAPVYIVALWFICLDETDRAVFRKLLVRATP